MRRTSVWALAALVGCGGAAATGPPAQRPGPVVHRDPVDAFSVPVPRGWRVAPRPLTPALADPAEVLSLGTGRMPVGGPGCAQVPVLALRAVGAGDALVTVFERRGPSRGHPPRRRPLPLGRPDATEVAACGGGAARVHWTAFRDAGRGLYLLTAIGRTASPRRRAEVRAVVEGLRIGRREAATFAQPGLRLRGTLPPGWRLSAAEPPAGVAIAAGTWPRGEGAACGLWPVPRDGAFALLVEVPRARLARSPPRGALRLSRRPRAGSCFGPARIARFRAAGRAFVAYVHLGPAASFPRRAEAVDLLRDLEVAR